MAPPQLTPLRIMQVHLVNYHLIASTSRHNINKLIKHKICTIDLSFQNTKNMLFSIKIQGENVKKLKLATWIIFLNVCIFRQSNPLSKNLKIFHLASKLREKI